MPRKVVEKYISAHNTYESNWEQLKCYYMPYTSYGVYRDIKYKNNLVKIVLKMRN